MTTQPSGAAARRYRVDRATSTAAAFCVMVSLSLSPALGFLVVPGAERFGVSTGEYLLWYSILILVAGLSFSFVGPAIRRYGVRIVLTVGGIVCATSLVGATLAPDVLVFYATAVPFGVGVAAATMLPGNVLVAGWHDHARRGTVLGIVAVGSGVGAVSWGFVMPPIVEAGGFGLGMLAIAGFFVLFSVLPGIFLARNPAPAAVSEVIPVAGARGRRLGSSSVIALFVVASFLLSAASAYEQIQPAVLDALGVPAVMAGHLVSFAALAGMVSLPLLGYLHDRLGIGPLTVVLALLFLCGLPLVAALIAPIGIGVLWPLVAINAVALAVPAVIVPLLASESVPKNAFPVVYGWILSAMFIGLAVSVPLWGVSFDLTGTYSIPLVVAGAVGALAVGALAVAVRRAHTARVQSAQADEEGAPAVPAVDEVTPAPGLGASSS